MVTRDRRRARKLFNRPYTLNEGSNSVAPLLAILLLIVITVGVIDTLTSTVRHRLIGLEGRH